HEFSGVVDDIGSKVTKFNKGDRVVINPTVSNREKEENIDLYDGYSFIGLGSDGGFAEFTNAPEDNDYKLPDNVSDKEDALVETIAVVVQEIKEGYVLFGDYVAIFGEGPIVLLTVVVDKAVGESKIFVFDLSEERLNKAKVIGATHTINSAESNPSDVINKYTDNGVDVAFEVAGVAPTLKSAIDVTRARGTVVIVSIFGHPIEWNPIQLTNRRVKLNSTIAYTHTTYQKTINLIK